MTAETSHVVCSEPVRRTVNLLKGLMRGCWLLSREWLFASVERGRWADEEDFELTSFSAAAGAARREREAFGRCRAAAGVLAACPPLHFSSRGCRAPLEDLRQLAALGGARVARVARAAGVVVGEKAEPPQQLRRRWRRRRSGGCVDEEDEEEECPPPVCVSETWFFDSLQSQQVLPFEQYLL